MLVINAKNRFTKGTNASRRLRLLNKFPGILYGKGVKNVQIELDHSNILNISHKLNFKNDNIIAMILNDKKILVKVKNIQYHAFKKKILHIDFYLIN